MRPAGLSSSPAPANSCTERQGTIVGELLLSFSPLQTDGETEAFSLLLPFGEVSFIFSDLGDLGRWIKGHGQVE